MQHIEQHSSGCFSRSIEEQQNAVNDADVQLNSGDQIEYLEDLDIMTSAVPMLPPTAPVAQGRFCRVCLKKSESFLLPLVAKMERVSVMEMLVDVTGIELEVNALYPTKVCTNCMTKLDFAYNVRQEFLSSTELLLKMAVEGRLPAYYAQFNDENDHGGYGAYTDEILKASKSILGEKTAMSVHQTAPEKESEEILEEDEDECDDIEDIKVEQETIQETSLDVEVLEEEETLLTVQTNNSKAPESNQEKFVYSWKELVKPKRTKKERPKNAVTGIKRKAKADSDLLAKFPQTTCYICDTPHDTLEQRDEHLNAHISLVPHRCETCSTETEPVISKSVLTLNRHRLMHHLPYECNFCYRRFISSGSQYAHVWNMHMGDNEGLTCDFCGKGFAQKRSFQAHVRRHRYKANGKYKCDICEETCGSSLLLARHQRKHTGEKNFACPYCQKTFSRACNLITHKRIHTNERCHKCSECGSGFRDNVTLQKHQARFHLGKIPPLKVERNPYIITEDGRKEYTCKYEDCSYTTFSSTAISRHKARHSKRYTCGECGKRFAEPNQVRRHQVSMHSGKKASNQTVDSHQPKSIPEQEENDAIEEEVYLEEEYDELKVEPEYEVEVVDEMETALM